MAAAPAILPLKMENVAIPIDLSAFVLTPECASDKAASRIAPITQPNYIGLRLDEALMRHDLTDHVENIKTDINTLGHVKQQNTTRAEREDMLKRMRELCHDFDEEDDEFSWPVGDEVVIGGVLQLDEDEPELDVDKNIECPDCEYRTNRRSNFSHTKFIKQIQSLRFIIL